MAPARMEGVICRERRTPVVEDLDDLPIDQRGGGEVLKHVGLAHPRGGGSYERVAVIDDEGRLHLYPLRHRAGVGVPVGPGGQ